MNNLREILNVYFEKKKCIHENSIDIIKVFILITLECSYLVVYGL